MEAARFGLAFLFGNLIDQNVCCDQKRNRSAKDQEHAPLGNAVLKEVDIAVYAVAESFDRFVGNSDFLKLLKHAAQCMIAQERGGIRTGEEGENLLQTVSKVGDRHICSADKAVAGADD